MTWKSLLAGGCLLLNESSVVHAAISNHLSEKPVMCCFIWSLNTGLTVHAYVKTYKKDRLSNGFYEFIRVSIKYAMFRRWITMLCNVQKMDNNVC